MPAVLYPLLALLRNLLLSPLILLRAVGRRLARAPAVVEVPLRGSPPYLASPWGTLSVARAPSLVELQYALDRIAEDGAVRTVLFRVGPLSCGWGRAYALRRLLERFGASGKRRIAWLVEPGHRELYVASACDELWLHEASPALITGVSAEVTFFGEALSRIGVQAQMERAGEYKGAPEMLTRARPSEPFVEALGAVLGSLQGDLVEAVAAGRGWDVGEAARKLDAGPYLTGEVAASGLVDRVCTTEELPRALSPDDRPVRPASAARYLPSWRLAPLARPPGIALVSVRGVIRTAGPSGASMGASGEEVSSLLDQARRSASVQAVVLHVDSRGGSGVGSDLIWQAVRRTRVDKPVIAWLGEHAASGGYYAACAADHVVAAPGTLTGSIGVFAGKVVVRGLLERLGLHREVFAAAPRGGMFSAARPFDDEELDFLRREVGAVYDRFLRCVAEGRGMSTEVVEEQARGRVWTGRQALERGLVDSLGAWPEVLKLARERAAIPTGRRARLIRYRPRGADRWPLPTRSARPAPAAFAAALAGLPDDLLPELEWLAGPDAPRVVAWCPAWLRA